MSDDVQDPELPRSGRGAVPEWSPPPPGYPAHPPTLGGTAAPPTVPTPTVAPTTTTEPVPVVPAATTPTPVVPSAAATTVAPGGTVPAPVAPGPTASGGTANWFKVVLALAVTAIVVGAVGSAVTGGLGAPPRPEVTVDQCDITPRGEVIAGGSVTNRDDARRTVRLSLELRSLRGGTWSTPVRVVRVLDPGDRAEWSASVTAPSNVEQVRCVVTDARLD